MNTANLQLEGLYLAIAAINRALVAKGILGSDDIARALSVAEATAIGDDRMAEGLSSQQRDAVCFPIRVLRLANEGKADVSFSALARQVGLTKPEYGDEQ